MIEFFKKNGYLLLTSFIVITILYVIGYKNIYTLDSSWFSLPENITNDNFHLKRSRFGSYVLLQLFPFLQFQIVSLIFGNFFIILSAILLLNKYNISFYTKLLYVTTIGMFPSLPYLHHYFFQSGYNFLSVLLAVIAYQLIDYKFKDKYKYIYFILSIMLLTISISSYQTIASVFAIIVSGSLILDYIFYNDDKKSLLKKGITSFVVLIVSILLYFIITYVIQGNTNIYGNYFGYATPHSIMENIIKIIFGKYEYRELYLFINIILIIISMSYFIIKQKGLGNKLFIIFLFIIFILSSFSTILIYARALMRNSVNLPFLAGYSVLFILIIEVNSKIKTAIFIFFCYIISLYSYEINKLYNGLHLRYEIDKEIGRRVLNLIYNKAPNILKTPEYRKKVKLVFIGPSFIHNTHPYVYYGNKGEASFGESYFTINGGSGLYIMSFLTLMGLPIDIKYYEKYTDYFNEIGNEEKNIIEKMPIYPSKDSVELINNNIIVKFIEIGLKNEILNCINSERSINDDRITIQPSGYCYGPYISLNKGRYKIKVTGENLSKINFDAGVASKENGLFKLDNITHTDKEISYEFNLDKNIDNVEFRFFNKSTDNVTINNIEKKLI